MHEPSGIRTYIVYFCARDIFVLVPFAWSRTVCAGVFYAARKKPQTLDSSHANGRLASIFVFSRSPPSRLSPNAHKTKAEQKKHKPNRWFNGRAPPVCLHCALFSECKHTRTHAQQFYTPKTHWVPNTLGRSDKNCSVFRAIPLFIFAKPDPSFPSSLIRGRNYSRSRQRNGQQFFSR